MIMGLNVCGVDLLRTNRGPVVMEINSSPGLEGIEKATGVDIAGKIIKYMEKHAIFHKGKRKKKASVGKPEA
jgi:ribosomal protein S6--L-glutamate ligase